MTLTRRTLLCTLAAAPVVALPVPASADRYAWIRHLPDDNVRRVIPIQLWRTEHLGDGRRLIISMHAYGRNRAWTLPRDVDDLLDQVSAACKIAPSMDDYPCSA